MPERQESLYCFFIPDLLVSHASRRFLGLVRRDHDLLTDLHEATRPWFMGTRIWGPRLEARRCVSVALVPL